MSDLINKSGVPSSSQIAKHLDNTYYQDAYQFSTIYKERNALQVWLAHATSTPAWISYLMTIRNKIVSLFGLKDLGDFVNALYEKPPEEYQVGDRIGIFTLLYLSDNEVILGDSDKHLNVKISIFKPERTGDSVTISTLVHVHNFVGRVYMLFVAPIHKVVVPATIKRAEFS